MKGLRSAFYRRLVTVCGLARNGWFTSWFTSLQLRNPTVRRPTVQGRRCARSLSKFVRKSAQRCESGTVPAHCRTPALCGTLCAIHVPDLSPITPRHPLPRSARGVSCARRLRCMNFAAGEDVVASYECSNANAHRPCDKVRSTAHSALQPHCSHLFLTCVVSPCVCLWPQVTQGCGTLFGALRKVRFEPHMPAPHRLRHALARRQSPRVATVPRCARIVSALTSMLMCTQVGTKATTASPSSSCLSRSSCPRFPTPPSTPSYARRAAACRHACRPCAAEARS